MKLKFSRRDLVARFGPAALLMWPLLSASRAHAQALPRRRFLTFFSASGVLPGPFWPKGTPGTAASGSYTVDGTSMAALKPFLGDIVIAKGIRINRGPGDAHNGGSVAILTGDHMKAESVNTRPFAFGESLDQVLSRTLSAGRPEASLQLAVRLKSTRISRFISYSEGGYPIYPIVNPYVVYDRVFKPVVATCAGSAADSLAAERLRFRRMSVLDAVRSQTTELSKAVGLDAEERGKLERMETSIRSIERRLETTTAPVGSAERCVATKATMETETRVADADENFPELLRLQMDLLALAFELDITRVGSLMLTLGGSAGPATRWVKYKNAAGALVPIESAHHTVSHGDQAGVAEFQAKLEAIDRWNMSQFAYLLGRLKEVDEGGQSILDNSIVWHASDVGYGYTHTTKDMPFIIAGKAGGAFKTGRYVQLANEPNHQRLLLSYLKLLGDPAATEFGRPGACEGGPLLLS